MKNRLLTQVVVAVVCGLLAGPALSPLSAAPAAMGRVVANAPAKLNGVLIPREATVFSGDRLTTGAEGWARLYLAEGEQIHLAALSEARAARAGERVDVELMNGQLLLQTRAGSGVNVQANGLAILPVGREAVWEVTRTSANEVLVAARSGSVEIHGINRNLTVPAGRSARVTTTAAPASPAPPVKAGGLTAGQKGAIIAGIVGGVIATAVIVHNQTESNQLVSPSGL
ncbi:MAG: FecR domain-containing protein [Acidobacteria bacterium]|nr:FecR domain-containing protein [Acidobacteriota bacterium]